ADEENVQRGLLDEPVGEECRRVDREQYPAENADRLAEELAACRTQQRARERAQDALNDADGEEVVPEDRVEHAEEVGVEGRLVEDALPEPVSSGKRTRPIVVHHAVADEPREAGSVVNLPQVEEANREGERADRNPGAEGQPLPDVRWRGRRLAIVTHAARSLAPRHWPRQAVAGKRQNAYGSPQDADAERAIDVLESRHRAVRDRGRRLLRARAADAVLPRAPDLHRHGPTGRAR